MNTHIYKPVTTFALFLGLVMVAGCSHERESTPNAEGPQGIFKLATGHDVAAEEYVIDPPDEITIYAPNIKEIDKAKITVRADGKIPLNLLGEVKISGMSPEAACDKLKEIAGKYYTNPDIKIDVKAESKFYRITGPGVNNQGPKPFTGNNTIISAVADAGFNFDGGWPQQVCLSRPAKDGHEKATAVIDFTKVFQYADLTQNYLIEKDDIIWIPDSPLTHLNKELVKVLGPLTGAGAATSAASPVIHTGG